MTEEQEYIETSAIRLSILEDRAQQYHNMLACIHDLKEEEREQILTWKTLIEEEIENLKSKTDAEVALHP